MSGRISDADAARAYVKAVQRVRALRLDLARTLVEISCLEESLMAEAAYRLADDARERADLQKALERAGCEEREEAEAFRAAGIEPT